MGCERWKPIDFAPGYEVSDRGRIRSFMPKNGFPIPHLRHPFVDRDGHHVLTLRVNKKSHFRSVHRLVALAFLGNPPTGKNEVCHKDGNPSNNRLGNLKWGSTADNTADRIRHGRTFRGERKIVQRLTKADAARAHELRSEGLGLQEIADELKVSFSHVSAIIGGRRWRSAYAKAG